MIARKASRARANESAPIVTRSSPTRVRYGHFGAYREQIPDQAGYRSATIAARDGPTVAAVSGSRAHEIPHREMLQRQSRQFRRDNGLYAGMIRRARSFIVGNGFKLQCQTRSRKWNETTEAAFAAWWRRPEVTGLLSGSQVEDLVCDELLTCGETGVALTSLGLIQLFEAEQIRSKGRASGGADDGIERDAFGRPTRFNVCPYGPNGQPDTSKSISYAAGEFLYIASLERPSSGRAVPPCQASFPMIHRADDIANSEAIGWQMRSKLAAGINRAGGTTLSTITHQEDGEDDTTTEGVPTGANVMETEEGIFLFGEPGDTFTPFNQAAPASTFEASMVVCIRLLGVPLGLPIEMLLLDWTKSNYSQSRAVLEQARVSFLSWQDLLETHFYRPVFMWWLEREIAAGNIQDRADKFDHDWNQPQPPWIDGLAEAQAQGEKIDRGLGTHASACKAQNTERPAVVAQLEAETIDAIQVAQRIKAATGTEVPWEFFAGKKPIQAVEAAQVWTAANQKQAPAMPSKPDAPKPSDAPGQQPGKPQPVGAP